MKRKTGDAQRITWRLTPRVLILAAALVAVLCPGDRDAHAQTLREALAATYATNPEIRAQRDALNADAELIPQALSGWYRPTVTSTLTNAYGYTEYDDNITGSTSSDERLDEDYSERSAELEISMDLYNGGSSSATIRYARAAYAATRAVLASTEQQVLAKAADAYLDVVRVRRLLELAERDIADLQALKAQVDGLLANRRTTVTEVEQVAVEIADSEGRVESRRIDLATAIAAYEAVVGSPPGGITEWPSLPSAPSDFAALVQQAERHNPRVVASQSEIDARQASADSEAGELLPTLTVYGTATYTDDDVRYSGTSTYDSRVDELDLVVGLQLSIPIYDGGSQTSAIRQKKRLVSEARSKLLTTQRAVTQEARTAWGKLQGAGRYADIAYREWLSAETILEGRYREFERRALTVKDLIDAHIAVRSAQEKVIEQTYAGLSATVDLLTAAGRFDLAALGVQAQVHDPDAYAREVERRSWVPYFVR